jgi:hypothetical protein
MIPSKRMFALVSLRLVLGGVVLVQASILAMHREAIVAFGRTGLPDWTRALLAWGEIGAAALFLFPATVRLGGWLLILAFTGAMLLHFVAREFNVGALLIYVAAIAVVLTHRQSPVPVPTCVESGAIDG